ncbi:MAG: hypothetical protein ABSC06_20720 [Rhodopila sp.]|jgi:hypothetical protein
MNNPGCPDTIPAEDVPVCVNVFGDATRIARALGLDIELPDVDGGSEYWQAIWAKPGNWKAPLRGTVSDLGEENGDPEWAELINYGSFSVHFDVEEGIRFRLNARDLPEVLNIVRGLRARGVPLWDTEIGCLVWVNQSLLGYGVPLLDEYSSYCGLVGHMTSRFERPVHWELPRSQCGGPGQANL